jgi:hypothetical protein
MTDAGSSSRSHNSVTEPTYLLTQVSVHKQDIAVLTELGRISSRKITGGEMKSFKPTTSFASFHQVIRWRCNALSTPICSSSRSRAESPRLFRVSCRSLMSTPIPRGFFQRFNFPRTQRPFEMTYVIRENNYVHVSRWGGIQLYS